MSHIINVSVKNHVAKQTDKTVYVCGNDDFVINFDFDSEWDQYDVKTARFTYGGNYVDVVFTGNTCAVPIITNVWRFKVGVFAGDLSTTTPVLISASKSILCETGTPAAPTDDVYNQIIEVVNEATTASNEAKAAAEAVTPDDTAIDGKPWTSKHIVDMLCPPIEETGNPIQCYPVPGYPIDVVASWEPTQEGSGDPSPDNVRPITGRDSVQVQVCGENLVNIADFTLSVDDNTRADEFYLPTSLPAGTYVINLNNSNANSNLGIQLIHKEGTAQEIMKSVSSFPATVTLTKSLTCCYFYISNRAGNSTAVSEVTITTAQAEYTPYTGTTQTLTLPETIYGGSVANDGNGVKEWNFVNKDNISKQNTLEAVTIQSKFCLRCRVASTNKAAELFCNGLRTLGDWATLTDYSVCWQSGNFANLVMYIPNMTSKQDYLDYFSANDLQIAYKSAEPTTFTATGGGELTGLDGLNNVLTDADSVTVEGREDIKHTIKELQDALASVSEG